MTLKEIRQARGLTQSEAAILVNVPLRTYVRYENNDSYQGSFKYEMLVKCLNEKTLIDEDHGILTIDMIKDAVVPLLKKHDINYCYLFGSYAEDRARENSDVDLLIDTDLTGLEFLGLVEDLRINLSKKVDLLRLKDLEPGNPIILEILKKGVRII